MAQGRPAGDFLQLGPIKVHGKPPPTPSIAHPRLIHFADQIDLLGYDMVHAGAPDDETRLILYWAARGRPSRNYTVFVHALGKDGNLIGQADFPPRSGKYPTAVWDAGDIIVDHHLIQVDPAKVATYEIGLYRPATGQRLAVLGDQAASDTVRLRNDR